MGIPVIAITPKVSLPVSDKLRVGAGLLYGFTTGIGGDPQASGGVGYALATYGTADPNFTVGLGYGVGSDGIGSTPVGVLGANVRLARLFTLVNETYLASLDRNSAFGG